MLPGRPILLAGCSHHALPLTIAWLHTYFVHAGIDFDNNPKRVGMLAADPTSLSQTAAGLLRQSEGVRRDGAGRPVLESIEYAAQAGLAHLHRVALLKGKQQSDVNATTR